MAEPRVISMLDAALEYARHGDSIFQTYPVIRGRCACGVAACQSPGKHPLGATAPHGLEDATTDEAMIRHWFSRFPTANIAMRTGVTRTVLDVDPAHGGRESLAQLEARHGPLPITPKVHTGGGGEHYHFAHVPGLRNSAGKIAPGLDIRGEGGYVLVPPSSHVSGGVYRDDADRALFETAPSLMPEWLVALAMGGSSTNGTAPRRTDDEWAEMLRGAPEGQRREEALKIAGRLLGKGLSPVEVTEVLLGVAARCVQPFPEREAREIVRDLARKDRAKPPRLGSPEHASEPIAATSHETERPADGPVVVRLADVAPEAVDWLWPRRLARGKLTLVIGEPGGGKTYFVIDCGARVTRGAPWPDGTAPAPGAVIVLTSEDGIADTLRPRLDHQGGDPAHVHILRAVRVDSDELPFTLERDLPQLARVLTERPDAALVILDPVSAYLGGRDSYKDAEIRGLLSPLASLAERFDVALLAILHLTKAAQRKLLLRAQGSIAFVAQARVVLAVGEDPEHEGRRLLVPVKNNLGPAAPALAFRITDAGLTWEDGTVEGAPEQLLANDDVGTRSERRERDDAAAFLRHILREGPVSSKQIAADATANGIARATLWRAKADLGITAERTRTAEGNTAPWYWTLPARP
jgi:Bifunctional DNA primase/polymerase, N-terminal/AAA domain